jgi:hypothetical protein
MAGAGGWLCAILSHSARRLAPTRRSPDGSDAFSRIVSFDVFPVARRLMLGGQPEQRFERNMPVEAAIVAKNEFIEISVEVLAPQAMIRAQAPWSHQ